MRVRNLREEYARAAGLIVEGSIIAMLLSKQNGGRRPGLARRSSIAAFLCTLFIALAGCGGSSPQLAVVPNPSTNQTIDQGQTVDFTVAVFNLSSNATS